MTYHIYKLFLLPSYMTNLILVKVNEYSIIYVYLLVFYTDLHQNTQILNNYIINNNISLLQID